MGVLWAARVTLLPDSMGQMRNTAGVIRKQVVRITKQNEIIKERQGGELWEGTEPHVTTWSVWTSAQHSRGRGKEAEGDSHIGRSFLCTHEDRVGPQNPLKKMLRLGRRLNGNTVCFDSVGAQVQFPGTHVRAGCGDVELYPSSWVGDQQYRSRGVRKLSPDL